jgi:hypothetical protein
MAESPEDEAVSLLPLTRTKGTHLHDDVTESRLSPAFDS